VLWHVDVLQGRHTTVTTWLDELPCLVFQPGHRQSGALCEPVLYIPDGSLAVLNPSSYSFIARGHHGVARPGDDAAYSWALIAPLGTHGAEMIRESVGGATAVLPYHRGNIVMGQAQMRIDRLEARVIPGCDLAEKDVHIHIPCELQITSQSVQIVGQDNTASHYRKQLHTACDCRHLFIAHCRITGAEIHHSSHKLLDTLTTPDGFIAELHVRMLLLVFLQPFFIERRRKGGTSPLQLESPSCSTLFGCVVTIGEPTATDCQGHE